MKCPQCAAWSEVKDTRTQADGYVVRRRHVCANGHPFHTRQVHEPVFCSAKQRLRDFANTAKERASKWARNRLIVQAFADGREAEDIAREFGVSRSSVYLIAKQAREQTGWASNRAQLTASPTRATSNTRATASNARATAAGST